MVEWPPHRDADQTISSTAEDDDGRQVAACISDLDAPAVQARSRAVKALQSQLSSVLASQPRVSADLERLMALLVSQSPQATYQGRPPRPVRVKHKGRLRSIFKRSARGAVRIALRIYRSLPIGAKGRSVMRGAAVRLAPRTYTRLQAAAGSPVAPPPPPNSGPIWLHDTVDDLQFRLGFWRISHVLRKHVAKHGRITHMVVLPFFARGGAEATAVNFCKAAVEGSGHSALLVAADRTLQNVTPFTVPAKVLELDLTHYFPAADHSARESLLLGLLRIAGPDVFHIINSEVGWRLTIKASDRIRPIARTFASIFAFQLDPNTGQKVGYASTFLRDGLPHLDGLLSDNYRFICDAQREYNLGEEAARMYAIYNPARNMDAATVRSTHQRLVSISDRITKADRLQVVWAGRLDAEKRIELLPRVAKLCPEMDFHVHGARVVDASDNNVDLQLPNVRLYGSFAEPTEVITKHEAHAFMFTSRWEGLPNVLLEFGTLGIPIVATAVGGVGELIDGTTGYPLGEQATAEDYAFALKELFANPAEAQGRATSLAERIAQRHSYAAFVTSVRSIPGYLSAGDRAHE
jgi:glycosyltransferase involved in cell wall biosynthesis